MRMIEVHDLPEPVAKAIEAMVQSLRDVTAIKGEDVTGPSIGRLLAPRLEDAWTLDHDTPRSPLQGQKLEIQQLIVEKFKRQGLNL